MPTGSVPAVTGSLRMLADSQEARADISEASDEDIDDTEEHKSLSLLHILLLIAIAVVLALLVWKADFEKNTQDAGGAAQPVVSIAISSAGA